MIAWHLLLSDFDTGSEGGWRLLLADVDAGPEAPHIQRDLTSSERLAKCELRN